MVPKDIEKVKQNKIFQEFGNQESLVNNNKPLYLPDGLYEAVDKVIKERRYKRMDLIQLSEAIGIKYITLYSYSKNEKYKDAFQLIKEFRTADIINNALDDNYNSTFSMFLLKSKYGYIEKEKEDLNEIRRDESKRPVVVKVTDEIADAFLGDINEYES